MRVRPSAYLAMLLLLALSSCAGSPAGDEAGPWLGVETAAPLELPPPSALKVAAADEPSILRLGAEFEQELSTYRVGIQGSDAHFTPQFEPGAGQLEPAWALYTFNTGGYDHDGTIRCDWGSRGDVGDLYFGVADYISDCWTWFAGGTASYVALGDCTRFTPFDQMMVVVVCTGSDDWYLERIRIGQYVPPEIISVTPTNVLPETERTFVAEVEGDVTDWLWDFGGGMTPNTSTGASPTATAGAELDFFYAHVTVSCPAGEDTFNFVLYITDDPGTYEIAGLLAIFYDDSEGIAITLSGDAGATADADEEGEFSFTELPPGDYTITPDGAGWEPPSIDITLTDADSTNNLFMLKLYPDGHLIYGSVLTYFGKDDTSIYMELSGPVVHTTRLNSGDYFFPWLPDGIYTLTPQCSLSPYFWPTSRTVVLAGENVYAAFLFALDPYEVYTISGTVTDQLSGLPIEGLEIECNNWSPERTVTNAQGYYEFECVPYSQHKYQVIPNDTDPDAKFDPGAYYLMVESSDFPNSDFERFFEE